MNHRQTLLSRTFRIGCVLLVGLIWLQLVDITPAIAQEDDSTYHEAYLEFRYGGGLVDNVITARYDGSQFYLSISEIFDLLKIEYQFDRGGQRITGFYLNEDRSYDIDVQEQIIRFGSQTYELTSSDFVWTELDLFLGPDVFRRVFGLNFTPSMRNLNLTLETAQTMPVVEQAARRKQRTRAAARRHLRRPDAPLVRTGGFVWFDAGVLDYTLGTNVGESTVDGRFNLQYGGMLLGGDIKGSVRGTYVDRTVNAYPTGGEWRLPVDEPYLRQIRAGQLSSTGLRQGRYHGVRFTNEPIRVRRTYGSYQVEGTTEPQWEVELYINGQLIDYTQADAQGRYTFDVPLSYGSTQITIRKYGPTGQTDEENRRLQVPFTFVPPGEIYYSVEGGRSRSPDVEIARSHASIGLTDWLTTQTGVDFVPDHPDQGDPVARYYNKLSARLGGNYILSVHAAPEVRYQASLNANYASQASFQMSYGYNYRDEVFNRFNQQEEVSLRGTLPIDLPYVPLLLRVDSRRQKLGSSRFSYRMHPSATFRLPGASRISIGYRGQVNQSEQGWTGQSGRLRSDLSYIFPPTAGALQPLSRLRLSTRAEYDLQRENLYTFSFDLSRRVFDLGRLRFSIARNLSARTTTGTFRLTLDLPRIRTSTSARYNRGHAQFSQDLTGAVAFDSRSNRVTFNHRGWSGRAGAAIRLFVDGNGNDRYDPGERIIRDGEVRFRRAQSTRTTSDGVIRATNLQPYDRYNVTVDRSTVPNPLWIPKQEEFSFVARPNMYTPIELPFYVAGVIEGSVLREVDGERRAVPGLDMVIEGVDSDYRKKIDVFNQGEFYDYTIPPGRYTISVDPAQRSALNVRSEPETIEFTVEHTEEGDYVGELMFLLYPRESPEPVGN